MTELELIEKLETIAKATLSIETIETRNNDNLDFHELSVWEIKRALQLAFELGKQSK